MNIEIILNSDIKNVSREEKLSSRLSKIPFSKKLSFSFSKLSDIISSNADYFIFIENDNFYWNEFIWNRFLDFLIKNNADLVVPIGNHFVNDLNISSPFYLTLNDLEKINLNRNDKSLSFISEEKHFIPLFAISAKCLLSLENNIYVGSIKNILKGNSVTIFNEGWLHYFNYNAGYDKREDLFELGGIYGDVLEIGCFKGAMASLGKSLNNCKWTGIDIGFDNLKKAKKHVDFPIIAEISNRLPIKKNKKFDFIICADFIEHIAYPWDLLEEFKNYIKKDGKLILSVPNIGHWSIVKDLMEGRFDEVPSGTLCVTHLRHGTFNNWSRWIVESGWRIEKIVKEKIPMDENFRMFLTTPLFSLDEESLNTYRFKFVLSYKS